VQKRFATEETDVPNTSSVKNLQSSIKLVSIDPSQVFATHFAIREVAKVTRRIARIGDSNVAQCRPPAPDEA